MNRISQDKFGIAIHLINDHEDAADVFSCPFCTFYETRGRKDRLAAHLADAHKSKDISEEGLQCKECLAWAPTQTHLRRHVSDCHSFRCKFCTFQADNEGQLVKHGELKHVKQVRIAKCLLPFTCCFKYCKVSCWKRQYADMWQP